MLGADKTAVMVDNEVLLGGRQHDWGPGNQAAVASAGDSGAGASTGADAPPPLGFSEDAVRVVVNAVESYAASARRILQADEIGVQQGRPLQVKCGKMRHATGVEKHVGT